MTNSSVLATQSESKTRPYGFIVTIPLTPVTTTAKRASDYCAMYNLKAIESLVVVVTTQYPDVAASPGNYIKVSLNGLGSTDVYTLLGLLADQVLSGKLDQQQIDSKKYWQEWGSF